MLFKLYELNSKQNFNFNIGLACIIYIFHSKANIDKLYQQTMIRTIYHSLQLRKSTIALSGTKRFYEYTFICLY